MPDSTSMARSKSRSGLEYFIEHVVLYDSRSESIPKGMLEHRPHCLDAGGLICHQNPFFGQRPRREPEGTKSCRIQGESLCLYIHTSACPHVPRPPKAGPPQRLAQASLRWMYRRTNGQTDGRTDGRMYGRTHIKRQTSIIIISAQ